MPYVTWSRSLPGSDAYINPKAQWFYQGRPQAMDPMTLDTPGSQVTYSWRTKVRGEADYGDYEGLSGEDLRKSINAEYKTRFDNGHEFSTWRRYWDYQFNRKVNLGYYNSFQSPSAGYMYSGPLRPQSDGTTPLFPTMDPPPSNLLNQVGTKLIGMTIPTPSEAAASTFLSEILKDGLPRIPGIKAFVDRSRTVQEAVRKSPGQGADEYLNYVFGAKPFIGDLRRMAHAVVKAGKAMKQYRRDSDNVVRRKAHLGEETSFVSHPNETSDGFIGLPRVNFTDPRTDLIWSSMSPQFVNTTYTTRYSFAGAYTYHLNEAHSFFGKLEGYVEKANHLLGIELNLETLWELTNWSWLVDWFFDVSSVLKNIDLLHSNSTVLRYGYVMCHQTALRKRVVKDMIPNAHSAFNTTGYCSVMMISSEALYESKTRTRATPYGFGLSVGSFTDAQWAILGALGMTRGTKALRTRE